jgi:hypothetical protein
MLSVLANRTYRSLFAAQVIAMIGTGVMTVALGLLALNIYFLRLKRSLKAIDGRLAQAHCGTGGH